MARIALVALVAFALGALAYRYHAPAAALLGVATGHDRDYAEAAAERETIACPTDAPVLLILGQSNAANTVRGFLHEPKPGTVNFNALDGRCYVAREPLLGMWRDGYEYQPDHGSIWTLVADGLPEPVTLAPIAQVGSSVADWSEGYARGRLLLALDGLKRAGLAPTAVLWHQGETDAAEGTPGEAYERHFRAVLATLRNAGVDAPVYVAQASVCRNFGSEEIRAAQARVTELPNVRPAPDTDTLSHVAYRYDGCHFSAEGAKRAAQMWIDTLLAE